MEEKFQLHSKTSFSDSRPHAFVKFKSAETTLSTENAIKKSNLSANASAAVTFEI
jgi:hypothetical protein